MSKIKLECDLIGTDSKFAQINSDGTLKCPVNWIIRELSEVPNRYYSVNGIFNTYLAFGETATLPIKTQSRFLTEIRPTITFTVKVFSTEDTTVNVVVYDGVNTPQSFNIVVQENVEITANLQAGGKYVKIYQTSQTAELIIYEGVKTTIKTEEIDFINEFTNYNIQTNLKDDVTIGNTVHQRKLGKTITSFTSEMIISPNQNKQILDVLAFSRINRVLTNVIINDENNADNILANMPQESGDIKYYYKNHISSQKSGLYENLSISYQHDPINGVY